MYLLPRLLQRFMLVHKGDNMAPFGIVNRKSNERTIRVVAARKTAHPASSVVLHLESVCCPSACMIPEQSPGCLPSETSNNAINRV